ncbi:uncharacterized protein LOC128207236 [Mya arenaria]|uniref:uncharacterized protein LOC128207236 n=1 Tax=Mya arenaria TaxID=6604 RepID=UPI0022E33E71|nr:uncharacterized protein LOC128207236 [Mya arenaria]
MWSTNWILIYLFVPLLTLGQVSSFTLTIRNVPVALEESVTLPIEGSYSLLHYLSLAFEQGLQNLQTFTTTYYPGQGFYVFAINGDESVPNDYGWQVTDNGTIVTVGLDSYFPTDGSNIMVAMVEVPKFLLTVENTFNENLLNVSVRLPVREGRTLIQYLPDAIKRQDTALLSFSATYEPSKGYTVNIINDVAENKADKTYWSVLKFGVALEIVVSQYVPVPDDEITFRFATYSGLQPPSPSAVPLPNNTPPTPQQATINYTIINNIMDPTFSNMITLAVDAGSPMINYMERACDTRSAEFKSFSVMYMVEFDGYFVYAVNGVVADWQTTYWILTNNTDQITAGVSNYVPVAAESLALTYTYVPDNANTTTEATPA